MITINRGIFEPDKKCIGIINLMVDASDNDENSIRLYELLMEICTQEIPKEVKDG